MFSFKRAKPSKSKAIGVLVSHNVCGIINKTTPYVVMSYSIKILRNEVRNCYDLRLGAFGEHRVHADLIGIDSTGEVEHVLKLAFFREMRKRKKAASRRKKYSRRTSSRRRNTTDIVITVLVSRITKPPSSIAKVLNG